MSNPNPSFKNPVGTRIPNSGRKPGSKSEITKQVREAFSLLLESQIPHLQGWLEKIAEKDPAKAMELWIKISERFVPSLSRTEITGVDGEAFAPITIQLPSPVDVTPTIPIEITEEIKEIEDESVKAPSQELPEEMKFVLMPDLPKPDKPLGYDKFVNGK